VLALGLAALAFVAALAVIAAISTRPGGRPVRVEGIGVVALIGTAVLGGVVAGGLAALVALGDEPTFAEGRVTGIVTAVDPDGPRGGLCIEADDPEGAGFRELCAALAVVGPVPLDAGDRATGTWALLPPGDDPTNYVWFTLVPID